MPPVFGPRSPSHRRLWSRAAGRATARVPSQIAITLASRPSRRSSMTRAGPSPGRPARKAGRSPIACATSSVTITPLPAASPSALRTAPRAGGGQLAHEGLRGGRLAGPERAGAGRPDARGLGDLVAERLRRLEPGRLPVRAEDRDPGRPQRIGDARRRAAPPARPRPAPTRGPAPASTTAAGSSGSTGATRTCGSPAIPALPGATSTSLTPGSRPSFQASACSRPPPPSTRIRVGITSVTNPTPCSCRGRRPVALGPPRPLDGLRPLGPDRHEHDRHAGVRLERRHVASRVLGQVGEAADVVDRLLPALEVLVDRDRARRGRCRSTARRRRAGRRSRRRRTAGSSRCPTGCRAC